MKFISDLIGRAVIFCIDARCFYHSSFRNVKCSWGITGSCVFVGGVLWMCRLMCLSVIEISLHFFGLAD